MEARRQIIDYLEFYTSKSEVKERKFQTTRNWENLSRANPQQKKDQEKFFGQNESDHK